MAGSAIITRNLHKSYGQLKVLKGVNLEVHEGTILALLGPNGAGKTTMVRILSTLLPYDQGSATVAGFDVATEADKVRSVIGLTGQYAAIDEFLTGRENLRMVGRLYHLSRADANRRAEELLHQFDLMEAANRPAKTYSGGMSRRLDLAASLIATPPVIFLDEPTTGLDPRSRLSMWAVIGQLADQGATILLTTQHLEEADRLADQIVVIDDGKVIAEGTANKLKAKVGKERIEFTFANLADFETARKLMRGKTLQADVKKFSLSIANVGGVSQVDQLLRKLAAAKLRVESLSLHKPTLDDVFMQLTGHRAVNKANVSKPARSGRKGHR
ncbi:ATP-binding cassette domain-containing protein [Candidatus Microgenomates bacterium]|nr:ATP-binding cassette domain-containing protein [Candidatus Microgenomates bacterium]